MATARAAVATMDPVGDWAAAAGQLPTCAIRLLPIRPRPSAGIGKARPYCALKFFPMAPWEQSKSLKAPVTLSSTRLHWTRCGIGGFHPHAQVILPSAPLSKSPSASISPGTSPRNLAIKTEFEVDIPDGAKTPCERRDRNPRRQSVDAPPAIKTAPSAPHELQSVRRDGKHPQTPAWPWASHAMCRRSQCRGHAG